MKALTLTQPWAQLVADSRKHVETRSWSTPYRGPLAIHAAKGWSAQDAQLAGRCGYSARALPRGVVLCIVRLLDVVPTTERRFAFTAQEREYGDFSPGRYAWLLGDPAPVDGLVAARGMLGLWEWDA